MERELDARLLRHRHGALEEPGEGLPERCLLDRRLAGWWTSAQTDASKPVTSAPARPASATDVRDQETTGIQL